MHIEALRAIADSVFGRFDAACDDAMAQLETASAAAAIDESSRESRLQARAAISRVFRMNCVHLCLDTRSLRIPCERRRRRRTGKM